MGQSRDWKGLILLSSCVVLPSSGGLLVLSTGRPFIDYALGSLRTTGTQALGVDSAHLVRRKV